MLTRCRGAWSSKSASAPPTRSHLRGHRAPTRAVSALELSAARVQPAQIRPCVQRFEAPSSTASARGALGQAAQRNRLCAGRSMRGGPAGAARRGADGLEPMDVTPVIDKDSRTRQRAPAPAAHPPPAPPPPLPTPAEPHSASLLLPNFDFNVTISCPGSALMDSGAAALAENLFTTSLKLAAEGAITRLVRRARELEWMSPRASASWQQRYIIWASIEA